MAATNPSGTSPLGDVDFEAFYQGETASAEKAAAPTMPWDIGEPQPVLVQVAEAGQITGDVLDAGCGLGENAVYLAKRGHKVTGVDFSATAIQRATELAAERGVAVDFTVADATVLPGLDDRFDTVVDSALFHCFSPEQRQLYAAALHRVTRPGATVHLFCAADQGPQVIPVPFVLSESALRETFTEPRWNIVDLRLHTYTATFTPKVLKHLATTSLSDALGDSDPADFDRLETDEQGRIKFSVWKLHAQRA